MKPTKIGDMFNIQNVYLLCFLSTYQTNYVRIIWKSITILISVKISNSKWFYKYICCLLMIPKVLVISDYRSTLSVRPEAEMFIGLSRLGVDITIMTFGESEYIPKFEESGIEVIDFHPQQKMNKREISIIRDELIQGQYDILHLFNNKAIINGIQAAKKLDVKIVLYRGFAGNINWYDPISHLKFLHPRVDKIVCNSKGVEEYLHRQLFFDKSKTVTINKGHSMEWYENVPLLDWKKIGIPDDAFVMVNMANNRRMKGIPYLLEAMKLLPENLPVHLVLIGNNLDSPKNKKIIKGHTVENRIHFLGYQKEPLPFVKSSDVFVLPSIFGESITKSAIEAMSLGVAPILTDIPGNKELAIHDHCAWVVPSKNPKKLAEGISVLFQDTEKRNKLAKNAKEHIKKKINNKVTILKIKELYQELIHG